MISVFKNFYQKPQVLKSKVINDAILKMMADYDDGKKPLIDFLPKNTHKYFNDPEVKASLINIYYHKCAYCEQKTDLVIDQYRPKSRYPWLSFEWSNLLPSCYSCNVAKNAKFDIKGKALTFNDVHFADDVLLANGRFLKKELPVLIHPEVDSPENHISFNKSGFAIGRTERGRYTIDVCALNRPLLVEKRLEKINFVSDRIKTLSENFYNGFFKVKGQNFIKNIPKEFEDFFRSIYDLQLPQNEFSSVFQSIWNDNLYLSNDFANNEVDQHNRTTQFHIWKQLFLINKNPNSGNSSVGLASLGIQNTEGIRNLSITNLNTAAKWIFLTGENGYGKSTILKAIAAGLIGEKIDDDEARFKIELLSPSSIRHDINHPEKSLFDINEYIWQSDAFKPYTKVAAYGAMRTSMSKDYSNSKSILDNILGINVHLLNIERYLTDIYNRENLKSKFNTIVQTLLLVVPQLAKIEIDDTNDILEVKYFEYANDDKTTFEEVAFTQLATGIKSIVAMIGDILCRFMINNKDISSPKDIEGVVIIDELDIHLHPKWQKKLPELLSKAFPKIQFIASTHSPIPLLGAPSKSIFLTVQRNLEDGITVERLNHLENEISQLTPNLLLNSPIFGFADIFSAKFKPDDPVHTENTFSEISFNKQLKESLKEELTEEKKEQLRNLLNNKR